MSPDAAEMESLDTARVLVRRLKPADLDRVIALDAKVTDRRRDEYYRIKLNQALADTGVEVSLAAELDNTFVGFLLARVYYGEFGRIDQRAVLDTFIVHPGFRGQGVGAALLDQLRMNLVGLGIDTLNTEVDWDNQTMLAFFQHQGFVPAPRLILELDLDPRQTHRNERRVR